MVIPEQDIPFLNKEVSLFLINSQNDKPEAMILLAYLLDGPHFLLLTKISLASQVTSYEAQILASPLWAGDTVLYAG